MDGPNPSQIKEEGCVSEVEIRINAENILEEWDPQYDAMLGPMVGRIRSKPGGKLEMGEASVVDKNNRPMPKLRNTSPESSRYEERPVPPETLNVAQLRHITLPHQGKADDNNGHMDITKIADKFRIDVVQIQRSSNLFRCLRRTAAKREMCRVFQIKGLPILSHYRLCRRRHHYHHCHVYHCLTTTFTMTATAAYHCHLCPPPPSPSLPQLPPSPPPHHHF
ncbi:hypothetical protein ACSBR2_013524 [Camellia fascicularis]